MAMRRSLAVPLAIVALAGATAAQAWNATGHQIVAAAAYRALPGPAREWVDVVLRDHPDYTRWVEACDIDDVGLYVFMKASPWPDEIRRSGSPFDHAEWHYVNYPLRAPDFAIEPRPEPGNDIIFGLMCSHDIVEGRVTERTRAVIGDRVPTAVERAAHLAWLVHLVADIHQPLHCTAFFSDPYPEGDAGGNLFCVRDGDRPVKLHAFWDDAVGLTERTMRLLGRAGKMAADPELARAKLPELERDTTPEAWALESRQVAVDSVYLRGELSGARAESYRDADGRLRSRPPADAPPLPPGYQDEARRVSLRRLALAAFRLEDELRGLGG